MTPAGAGDLSRGEGIFCDPELEDGHGTVAVGPGCGLSSGVIGEAAWFWDSELRHFVMQISLELGMVDGHGYGENARWWLMW